MEKRTKILATVGPASQDIKTLKKMIKAGANLFRLNFSHGDHEYHKMTIDNIRKAMKSLNKNVGILQDISGPKVRVGDLEYPFELHRGDTITFVKDTIIGTKQSDKNYIVSINYPDILEKIQVDEYIYLYDGTIRAKVIKSTPHIKAVIENDGILSSRKGVNFPNTKIDIDVLTQKDMNDIAWGVQNRVDYFAISFVQNGNDMINAKKLLGGYKGKLIAKIEKFDAVENIDEILEHSDGLMVARGDLGIEVPYYDVPLIQKMLIDKANKAAKPVITATQMLLSMTQNERATRAEISDVANAVLDGTDVVMLSEESAVGIDPVNTVETMSNIIARSEDIYPFDKQQLFDYIDDFDVIQSSVTRLADDIGAMGILAITSSGKSAIKMSRYRPSTPIYAFSHEQETLNALTAFWGVQPVRKIKESKATKMIHKMLKILNERDLLDCEATYIATVGYPVGVPGSTNTIKILTPPEIQYYLNEC
jgi:pyruvate kinase